MKRTILALIALAGTMAFTSCEKNWRCKCTFNGDEVYNADLGKMSRDDAKERCNTSSLSLAGQTWDCDLY